VYKDAKLEDQAKVDKPVRPLLFNTIIGKQIKGVNILWIKPVRPLLFNLIIGLEIYGGLPVTLKWMSVAKAAVVHEGKVDVLRPRPLLFTIT
jgi:hypothetical protein